MIENKYKLILASASPRREELLKHSFLPFEIQASDIEENSTQIDPALFAIDLAEQKAESVLARRGKTDEIIIGSDTIVVFEGEILGKPNSIDEARAMLLKLSGKDHEVITAVNILSQNRAVSFSESTYVKFREISQDLLELYLNTGDSLDKAGSYGIQNQSLSFIEKLDGSYSNVVGFPIDRFIIELKLFLDIKDDNEGKWRELF
jgi:septum formation protein